MDKDIRLQCLVEKLVDELNAQIAENGYQTINLYDDEVEELNGILAELGFNGVQIVTEESEEEDD